MRNFGQSLMLAAIFLLQYAFNLPETGMEWGIFVFLFILFVFGMAISQIERKNKNA